MINSSIFGSNQQSMRIKSIALALLLFLPVTYTFSQYTEMINTNRPGVSQGAFSVGKNVLQVESGFFIGKEKHDLLETETNLWGIDYSIRYGLLKEELEISLIGAFQHSKIENTRGLLTTTETFNNFRSNTLGAKYLFYDPYRKMEEKGPNLYSWKANNKFQWADLIPAISIYAGANFDLADNPYTPEPDFTVSPKFVLSTQNNFVGGFVFVTNIIVDRITTDFPTYGYIVTLTHATNRYFSIFVENQGFKSDFYADNILRGGAAALVNENLHFDLSVAINFKDTPSLFNVRGGVAYRFDMHDTDEYIEEKGKSGREKRRAEKGKNRADKKARRKRNKRKDDFDSDDGDDDGGGRL